VEHEGEIINAYNIVKTEGNRPFDGVRGEDGRIILIRTLDK
jgi:hypothetical protein